MIRAVPFAGLSVVVTPRLPIAPSPGEVGRRLVRHGMADVLAWLGQPVGPKPDAAIHAQRVGSLLFCSADMLEQLTADGLPADQVTMFAAGGVM